MGRAGTVPKRRLVTRGEAATILGCSPRTVDKLIHDGVLDVRRIGADPRITMQSISRLAPPVDEDDA